MVATSREQHEELSYVDNQVLEKSQVQIKCRVTKRKVVENEKRSFGKMENAITVISQGWSALKEKRKLRAEGGSCGDTFIIQNFLKNLS